MNQSVCTWLGQIMNSDWRGGGGRREEKLRSI